MDANRAAQQLRRDSETPEVRQARHQHDAAAHRSSRTCGDICRLYSKLAKNLLQ